VGEARLSAEPESVDAGSSLPSCASECVDGVLSRPDFLLTAVESVRAAPIHRAVFEHAKIIYVMDGDAEVSTATGVQRLAQGSSFALGAGRWCRVLPLPSVRLWTIYADERFLRTQMGWFLPDKRRVRAGVHPHEWSGDPLVLHPGIAVLSKIEPLWRQISVLHSAANPPETIAVRTVELFARTVEAILPMFLAPEDSNGGATAPSALPPVTGRLTDSMVVGHVGRAVQLLRAHIAEQWTVAALAQAVAVSRTHLTRLFVAQTGVPPMRFLTETRLTEFTRLIEETDMSVAAAARSVGWTDSRTASRWFAKRFGVVPSQYRTHPHPHHADDGHD
jgi:AraC-like DNA-binding protein